MPSSCCATSRAVCASLLAALQTHLLSYDISMRTTSKPYPGHSSDKLHCGLLDVNSTCRSGVTSCMHDAEVATHVAVWTSSHTYSLMKASIVELTLPVKSKIAVAIWVRIVCIQIVCRAVACMSCLAKCRRNAYHIAHSRPAKPPVWGSGPFQSLRLVAWLNAVWPRRRFVVLFTHLLYKGASHCCLKMMEQYT